MKRLHLVLATAGIAVSLVSSTLAASNPHSAAAYNDVNTVRTYGDRDVRNSPYSHNRGFSAYGRADTSDRYGFAPRTWTYPDQSYGGPNGW